jgi:hypothetical protein
MTYLLDTSAWVAYLRQHGTPEAVRVRELVRDSADDLVDARDDADRQRVLRLAD